MKEYKTLIQCYYELIRTGPLILQNMNFFYSEWKSVKDDA